jgi:GDP-4-dehydro-6-deoxy-D-mannose reductase
MKRLLITGASGFVGTWAMQLFSMHADWGYRAIALNEVDLRDAEAVHAAIAGVRPDAVLHLAAQSFVPRSFEQPRETFEINLLGTLNLLQALKGAEFSGKFVFVSSGDVYGRVPETELPVSEARLPEPRSPYAVSKVAAEQLCLQWHRTEGLDVCIARPFNHIGPGQDARFVVPTLARQVLAIARGSQAPVIEAGDIDTTRDFLDVRDVVAAYAALMRDGLAGQTYTIGSGVERRVRDLLDLMCERQGVRADLRQDPSRMRPAEQRRMVADASLLRQHTGWSPQYSLSRTIDDILNSTDTPA